MKQLYESILSSTNSGKKKIVEDLENWLKAAFDNCTGNVFSINSLYSIDIKPKNGGYAVDIDTEWDGDYFRFNSWFQDTNKYVRQIVDLKLNKKPIDITYAGINFSKNDSFVASVKDSLTLCGGEFEVIDKLPKNCRTLNFLWMNNLGGGSPVRAAEIKDIAVDNFICDCRSNGTSTLSCMLRKINNITVRKKMVITDGMLGYSSLEKGARTFEQETSEMLDRFFANNNVDPAIVEFIPNPNQSKKRMSIYYNKQKQRWCTHFR